MTNYRRDHSPEASWFFTLNLTDRRQVLLTARIDLLRDSFRSVMRQHPWLIDAIVILPDHLHALCTLPADDADYALRWRLIKTAFTRALPRGGPLSASRQRRGERGIWQRRYWEHLIRDEEDFHTHMDYVHFNPVKHGLVTRVADWPYSTFHWLVEQGVYAADWGGSVENSRLVYGDRGSFLFGYSCGAMPTGTDFD